MYGKRDRHPLTELLSGRSWRQRIKLGKLVLARRVLGYKGT